MWPFLTVMDVHAIRFPTMFWFTFHRYHPCEEQCNNFTLGHYPDVDFYLACLCICNSSECLAASSSIFRRKNSLVFCWSFLERLTVQKTLNWSIDLWAHLRNSSNSTISLLFNSSLLLSMWKWPSTFLECFGIIVHVSVFYKQCRNSVPLEAIHNAILL